MSKNSDLPRDHLNENGPFHLPSVLHSILVGPFLWYYCKLHSDLNMPQIYFCIQVFG